MTELREGPWFSPLCPIKESTCLMSPLPGKHALGLFSPHFQYLAESLANNGVSINVCCANK